MAIRKWLTSKEKAEEIKVTPQTIRRMASRGDLPSAKKVGRDWRFLEEDDAIQDNLKPDLSKERAPDDERLVEFALSLSKQKKGGLAMRRSSRLPQRLNFGYGGYFLRKYSPSKHNRAGMDRWYIYFYDEHGKKHEKVIKLAASPEDAFEALEFERRKAFNRYLGKENEEEIKTITFKEFSVEFLQTHNKKNAQGDKSIINLHLIPHFGSVALDRISIKDVDTYLTEKEAHGLKQGTINQHLICLRKMLYKAKEYGYIKEIIPISKRQLAVTDAREGKEIPDEHFWMIHDKAEPFMQKMMIVSRLSSCRGNELRTLKWDCVKLDGDDSKFIIRPEFDKAKKGKQCVITEQMRPVFDELKKSKNNCEHVFTYSDRPINKSRFSSAWVKAVIDAGFKKGFYKFHDLRHTGITIMAHNGQVGFRTIQSLAGQHDAKTTQKYMHDNWQAQKEAAEVLTLDSNDKKVRHI